ncbi:MAG: hypothetical protein MK008_07570 [Bdellovibrionales bacterium]|nr:hypothetical protein [Bdellovibrionales bacterium]
MKNYLSILKWIITLAILALLFNNCSPGFDQTEIKNSKNSSEINQPTDSSSETGISEENTENEEAITHTDIFGKTIDGNNILIKGENFPNKAIAEPLYWTSFEESDDPESDLIGYGRFKGLADTNITAPGSNVSHRFDISRQDQNNSPTLNFGDSNELYVFKKIYYDFEIDHADNMGPLGLNLKILRLWSPEGNNIYTGYQGLEGSTGNPRTYAEYTGQSTLWGKIPFIPYKWHQTEIVYKASQVDVQDGIFTVIRDGVKLWDRKFRMRTSNKSAKYNEIAFDQISNGTGNNSLNIYYDDLYIDTTFTRIMLSDAPNLEDSRVLEVQIPLQWSKNLIEIKLRKGAHESFKDKYLLIIDEKNEVNKVISL